MSFLYIAKWMIDLQGIDINHISRNKGDIALEPSLYGQTALSWAIEKNHKLTISILKKHPNAHCKLIVGYNNKDILLTPYEYTFLICNDRFPEQSVHKLPENYSRFIGSPFDEIPKEEFKKRAKIVLDFLHNITPTNS